MKYENNKVSGVKIAYVGGGSRGWAWKLMSDLAAIDDVSGHVDLYDIDYEAAQHNEIIGNKFNDAPGAKSKWTYTAKKTLDEAVEGERLAAERHAVDSGSVACHVVGYVIRQSACIESCSHDSAHNHMQHVEYAQCLKEVAEGHDFFQTHHERGAQDGVGETSAQRRQEELRDVNVCRKDEIEREQVACQ